MRITNQMQFGSVQRSILDATEQMYKYQQQVSSGKALQSAADDPASYNRLMQLRQQSFEAGEYAKATTQLKTRMQSYESNLSSLNDVMAQAKTLGLRAANDTVDDQARGLLADQVDRLIDQAMAYANAYEDGRYIYAGSKDQAPPFQAVRDASGTITAVTYVGDDRVNETKVASNASLESSFSGAQVFGTDPNDASAVFGSLIALRDKIRSGQGQEISDTVANVTAAGDKTLGTWSQVGVRIQHLETLESVRQQNLIALNAEKSSIEDVNLPEAYTNLQQLQVTYQAALQVAAKLSQNNLLSRLG